MKAWITLTLITGVSLGGCQQTSYVNPRWSLSERIADELPAPKVHRNSPFQISRDARLVVAVQAESRHDSETLLVDAAKLVLARTRARAEVLPEPLLEDEAFREANARQADVLVIMRIVEWPDQPAGRTSVCPYEDHPECTTPPVAKRMAVTFRVEDIPGERLIDTISVTADPLVLAPTHTDMNAAAGDVIEAMFHSITP